MLRTGAPWRDLPGEYGPRHLYKERFAVECTFNLLEGFRRFATRYEKTLRNYAASVALACARCWLRIQGQA